MNDSPSGKTTWAIGSGLTYSSPYTDFNPSSSSRSTGFGWISVWPVEQESKWKLGSVSSSVAAAPPAFGRASSRSTSWPAFAR